MTDSIIRPAPPQAQVISTESQVAINSTEKKSKENDKIKDLRRILRVIDNICGPFNEYLKFNQCLKPEVRVLLDLNQSTMAFLAMKTLTKNLIDYQYMDIQEPSNQLMKAMEKTYANIDSVSDAIINSMKEMVTIMQNDITQNSPPETPTSPELSQESILSAMTAKSEGRLPL